MRQQMYAPELDDAVGGARQKTSTLVFLNIQKLDSLRTRRGEERTTVWLMLFYTANRLRETLKMEWAWIDLEIKGAPKSRAHYDMYHYVPEKRDALTRWVQRLAEVLGHDPNDVMKVERTRYQGRGPARKLGRRETYRARKARLAAQGRDLAAERHQRSQEAARTRSIAGS
jgi:hypothetical protein